MSTLEADRESFRKLNASLHKLDWERMTKELQEIVKA